MGQRPRDWRRARTPEPRGHATMATKQKKTTEFTELPVLPVRDTVLFPHSILPLTVGREGSLKLINELKEEEKFIAVVAQRDPRVDNPQAVDLYQIGTAGCRRAGRVAPPRR